MITLILNSLVLKEQDVLHLAFYCLQGFPSEAPHIFRIARFEKVCTQQRMQVLQCIYPDPGRQMSQLTISNSCGNVIHFRCHASDAQNERCTTDQHLNDSKLHYDIMIRVGFSPPQQSPTFPPSFLPRIIFCHCSAAASCECMAANSAVFRSPNFAMLQQTSKCYSLI